MIIISLLSLSAVSAQNTTGTDNLEDNTDSDVLTTSDSLSNLQTLINNDETGKIDLTSDYNYSNSDSSVIINKTITINGNGHTIDVNSKCNLFNITASNIILNNLNIINFNINNSKTNGILWNGADGQLNNCNISNSNITSFLSNIILWNGTNGSIDSCTFSNNEVLNTTAVSFVLVWFGDNGKVSNSQFINNSGSDHAGAIYWGGGADNGVVYNSTFINNYAWYGGAIYWNGANGSVSKSYFKNNSAKSHLNEFSGGAIYWYNQDSEGVIDGCVFVNNNGKSGEAIALGSNTTLTVKNSILLNTIDEEYNLINVSDNTSSVIANNNWWGNTVDDYNIAPTEISDNVTVDNWLFLNTTSNPSRVYTGRNVTLIFNLTNLCDYDGNISQLSPYGLYDGDLKISSVTNGKVYNDTVPFNNGIAEVVFNADNEGNASITSNIFGFELVSNITVTPSSIQLTADDIYIGQNATVFAELPYDASGNVTFVFENENFTDELKDGMASASITNLSIGNYTVYAYYSGDENNNASNTSVTFRVLKKEDLNITIENTKVYENSTFNITVTVSSDDKLNITVTLNNETSVIETRNGYGIFEYSNLTVGNYTINADFEGNYKYNPTNTSAIITVVEGPDYILTADDFEKYYGASAKDTAKLTDRKGNPIVNETISFTINNKTYNRKTNATGEVQFAVNLPAGEYEMIVNYNESSINTTVTVKTTVNGTDITKIFKNSTQYYATFLNSEGEYLPKGTNVQFNINGVLYTRSVISNGLARMNINLPQGEYIITAMNLVTGEVDSNTITVLPRIINNNDLVKYYRNNSQYIVQLVDDEGNPVGAGETVTFNINGVFYNRTTNSSGYAKLNINLPPGNYIITASYKDCLVSNKIEVKTVLYADNLTMTYRDGSVFYAHVVDGQGNPLPNANLTFNINGVFYYRTTNSSGIASLNINLPAGRYIITSSYNGLSVANTIVIKNN